MTVRSDRDGAILTLTIDRPDARNALNEEVLAGLIDGFADARSDDGVRVVVLTGAGDRVFCAGADLGQSLVSEAGPFERHEGLGMLRQLFAAVERLDKPLVGRINGHALAGGFGVALACDLLVSADDATFGTPEVNVGMWPFVISALIVEHVGPKRALDMMMTGRRLSAQEAREWGLVNRVVPRQELDDAVRELTGQLAAAAPLALRLGRRAHLTTADMGRHEAMAYLHGMLDLIVQTDDVREGITAFFEKRPPEWSGT